DSLHRADRPESAGPRGADRAYPPEPGPFPPRGRRRSLRRGELRQGLPGRLRALPPLRGRDLPPGGPADLERARPRPLDALPALLRRPLSRFRARPAREPLLRDPGTLSRRAPPERRRRARLASFATGEEG